MILREVVLRGRRGRGGGEGLALVRVDLFGCVAVGLSGRMGVSLRLLEVVSS